MLPLFSGSITIEDTLYVEDVFSAFTYTGNGAARSIVNGIDLAGEGGLVWLKGRTANYDNFLFSTATGVGNFLCSNSTAAIAAAATSLTAFNANGFSLGNLVNTNTSGQNYVGWTFRKAPKFFDVVTYTGNGVARTIPHSLGVAPGMIIVKRLDAVSNWPVYHRSQGGTIQGQLNTTAAFFAAAQAWNNTAPTSTEFSVGNGNDVNANGGTYVAYLFAHDTTSDGIIQCGTFVGAAPVSVTLGWEPQFVIVKRSSTTGSWFMHDTARGFDMSSSDKTLLGDSSTAEATASYGNPTATGFSYQGSAGDTYIYMAIRKGLMRPPTDATKVFAIDIAGDTGSPTADAFVSGFPVDLAIGDRRRTTSDPTSFADRLRGGAAFSFSNLTAAEAASVSGGYTYLFDSPTGIHTAQNRNAAAYSLWMLRRARGFFDIVAYTGTGAAHSEAHNLGVAPELMIVKIRNGTFGWYVYYGDAGKCLSLHLTDAATTLSTVWNNNAPTASVFTLGTSAGVNQSTSTYIAYLFASCPGVSKVGTYTGTGTTLQVPCGFTAGARFVLIKRVDSTGDWYFWDTTRGIIAGNDPYLLLNSTAAEATATDYIDPYSAGFELSSTAPAALNASGGTYFFLALA